MLSHSTSVSLSTRQTASAKMPTARCDLPERGGPIKIRLSLLAFRRSMFRCCHSVLTGTLPEGFVVLRRTPKWTSRMQAVALRYALALAHEQIRCTCRVMAVRWPVTVVVIVRAACRPSQIGQWSRPHCTDERSTCFRFSGCHSLSDLRAARNSPVNASGILSTRSGSTASGHNRNRSV